MKAFAVFILLLLVPCAAWSQEVVPKRDTLAPVLRKPLRFSLYGIHSVSPLLDHRATTPWFRPDPLRDTSVQRTSSYLNRLYEISLNDRTWMERQAAERMYEKTRRRTAMFSPTDLMNREGDFFQNLLQSAASFGYDYAWEKYNARNLQEIDYLHLPLNTGQFRSFDDVRNEALQRGNR